MKEYNTKIGNNNITVKIGDITKEHCDAYIVPQDDMLCSGVGRVIEKAGASGIEEFQKIKDLRNERKNPVKLGEAYINSSGGGNSKYLLHVITVDDGSTPNPKHIENAFYNALLRAEEWNIKSVRSPAIGTGDGLPYEDSAKAIKAAIKRYTKENRTPIDITFNINVIADVSVTKKVCFNPFVEGISGEKINDKPTKGQNTRQHS